MQQVIDVGGMHRFAVRKDWAPLAHVLNRGIASMHFLAPTRLRYHRSTAFKHRSGR